MTLIKNLDKNEKKFEDLLVKTKNKNLIERYRKYKKDIMDTFLLMSRANQLLIEHSKLIKK